ncbi:hypothetical protein [Bifidobacterium tibiigranuli]|jgi:hypothetical protein|uniref:hypothetical protein n=1 Tax=Bifidobacterium tibiigranuli TaxID=2172043 RepID=UPI0023530EBA|nr:hypothetical protein [Bifidobacterium tibiigranuli]MCH3975572.1 hypothetical protein [Bifidobacterium tibiigranuli]
MDLDDSLLPDDPEALKAIIRGQRLENDVLREAVDLVRKDPAADPRRLANREKALIVFSQVGFLWLVTYFFRVSAWSVLLVIGCGFPCRT